MAASNRVYHHYSDLEEWRAGMWRIVRGDERRSCMERAAELMRDPQRFYDAMVRAIKAWPRSCDAAFTADAVNKIAWLGHAGCCLEANSPEEPTRCAWHTLNQSEQDLANDAAARALQSWDGLRDLQLALFGE